MLWLVVYSERNPFSLALNELEPRKQSIHGCEELRGCDVPMFFTDFHYVSFRSNSFSIGPSERPPPVLHDTGANGGGSCLAAGHPEKGNNDLYEIA